MSKSPPERDFLPSAAHDPSTAHDPSAAHKTLLDALGLLLLLCPLLGGTADRPYTLWMTAGSAVLCLVSGRLRQSEPTVSFVALGLLSALLLALLQTVPLPPGLRAVLSPGSDAALRQILAGLPALPQPPLAWLPLSVDVPATLHGALTLAGGLCLLVCLGRVQPGASSPTLAGAPRLYLWLLLPPLAVCLLGGLAALGLSLPSPVAVPGAGATRALLAAGLYNSNHMAALAGLGALLTLGLALAPSDPERRWLPALLLPGCALCNVALLGTLSRAGIATWLVAQGLLLAATYRRLPRRLDRAKVLRLTLAGLLCTGLLAALLADQAPALLHERLAGLSRSQLFAPGSKLHIWRESLPLLRGHLFLGVGYEAGENLLQHVHVLSGRMRFVYLENQWLQLFFDFGLLGAAAILIPLGLALRDAWRPPSTPLPPVLRLAAGLSLAALAVHNLFDFNLAVLGVAWPALGVVSLLQRPRFRLPTWAARLLPVLTLVGVGLVSHFAPSHDEDGALLRRLAADPRTPLAEVVSRAESASARHPFDSYPSALVAARLLQGGAADRARPLLNRALLANPRDPLALRETARLQLLSGDRSNAFLFLRLSIEHSDDTERRLSLTLLAQTARSAGEVWAALPSADQLAAFLDVAGLQAEPRWPLLSDVARSVLPPAVAPLASQERAAYFLGRAALAEHHPAAATTALTALLALPESHPPSSPTLLIADLLDLLVDSGQAESAARLGQAWLGRQRAVEWLLSTARAGLQQTPLPAAAVRTLLDEALASPQAVPGTARSLQARAHELYADLEAAQGNAASALSHKQAALRLRSP